VGVSWYAGTGLQQQAQSLGDMGDVFLMGMGLLNHRVDDSGA